MKHVNHLLRAGAVVALSLCSFAAAPQDDTDATQTQAECLQACFEQYQENLEACRESCWVCDLWIGWCWSGHHNEECLENCNAEAKTVWEACKADCNDG